MKKVIRVCIVAVLAVMTAACQNNSSSAPSSNTTSESQSPTKQEPAKRVKLELLSNLSQQSLKENTSDL